MTAPFTSGSLRYVEGHITFSNAAGLRMPFTGAAIVPRAASESGDISAASPQHSLYHPLLFPAGEQNGPRRWPGLRTMAGAALELMNPVIILVNRDPSVFSNFDFGALFSDGAFLTPQFPTEGALTSSRAKYLVLRLDGAPDLGAPEPVILDENTALAGPIESLPANASGTLLAFDFAGREIEADAALALLGQDDINDVPETLRVQMVDLFGRPLAPGDHPRAAVRVEPDFETPTFDADRRLEALDLPDGDRTLRVRPALDALDGVPTGERYLQQFVQVAVWPGDGAPLELIEGDGAELDLGEGLAAGQALPGFLRLCLFHPAQAMQTEVGGGIDEDGVFSEEPESGQPNGFALCSRPSAVAVQNDGETYFRDLYERIDGAGEGDKLFITNWAVSAHVHMGGTFSLRGLGPADIDRSRVDAALAAVEQNRILVPLGGGDSSAVLLADRIDRGGLIGESVSFTARQTLAPGEAARTASSGLLRADAPYAIPLGLRDGQTAEVDLTAIWKDLGDRVRKTTRRLAMLSGALERPAFPDDALALGVTAGAEPVGTVIRRTTVEAIRIALGEDQAVELSLLLFNVSAGTLQVIDLAGADPTATDLVLAELPAETTALDRLIVAAGRAAPDPETPIADILASRFASLAYAAPPHARGDIPFAPEELGGLLRRAMARGVEVRAIFWEQFLANLEPGEEHARGHSTNEEMAAVISRSDNGWAILDRATRPFGSFHQKGVVLQSGTGVGARLTAWLGGLDLGLGRWDTEEHEDDDPDRQSRTFWDVQARIEGPGAADVLRNFAQRWTAIGEFLASAATEARCLPRNADGFEDPPVTIDIPEDTATDPPEAANALVQITRTIPPRSCHTSLPATQGFTTPGGELGGLAAVLKAIRAARRFILINDQYFWSTEVALALHEALTRADGPDFLVLMLPRDLSEQRYIDPMLFKVRQKALHALFYGGTYTPPAGAGADDLGALHSGRIEVNDPVETAPVLAKTALLSAQNRGGKPIYVHSKHMIVDDVWMTVGSCDLGYRSTTYDFEINAGIVGTHLFRGGTGVVRQQRIELARRMLGLPRAYAPLIADPQVMFAHFKALEAKGENPAHGLHPLPPFCRKLDPVYVKKVAGDAAFNGSVDTISALDVNDPTVDDLAAAAIDPDGRSEREALAPFAALVTGSVYAYAEITLTVGCQALVAAALDAGQEVFVEIRSTRRAVGPEGGTTVLTPVLERRVPLRRVGGTVVADSGEETLLVVLSTETRVDIEARVVDADGTALDCRDDRSFDPKSETILTGSRIPVTLALS